MKTESSAVMLGSEITTQFLLSEYTAFRAELLRRIELRNQIASLTIIFAGSILTLGLQPSYAASILFILPMTRTRHKAIGIKTLCSAS